MISDILPEQKVFEEKKNIKPWLQAQLVPRGINIVIERSDDSKIVFKCRSNKSSDRSKVNQCPFRIRANYSLRSHSWALVVISDRHNHPLLPYPQQRRPEDKRGRSQSHSGMTHQTNSSTNSAVNSAPLASSVSSNLQNLSSQLSSQLGLGQQSFYSSGSKINSLQLELNNLLIQFNSVSFKNKEEIYVKLINLLKDSMGFNNPYYSQYNISEPLLLPQLPSLQPIRGSAGDFIKL
ncbi:unnamed protein product [Kuraishia capsulata CBS 1993]|uniref:Uncharacterized protein n=1 Tax=Kuraishia capsulata CBS 1993 TaxID=1382522 RepID=W6MMR3_9ASCO|nr:uncharacterized protein KUCA_T00003879001 [Kuraishia capsulata CBS 1993]CDK27899.1 unnamed protein product [Kuraishia capsulata CBS 1993]